jgi:hypothetical protein
MIGRILGAKAQIRKVGEFLHPLSAKIGGAFSSESKKIHELCFAKLVTRSRP